MFACFYAMPLLYALQLIHMKQSWCTTDVRSQLHETRLALVVKDHNIFGRVMLPRSSNRTCLQPDLKLGLCNLWLDVGPFHNVTEVHHSVRPFRTKSILQIFPLAIDCRLWAPAEAVLHARIYFVFHRICDTVFVVSFLVQPADEEVLAIHQ